jgi:hypothetical protein
LRRSGAFLKGESVRPRGPLTLLSFLAALTLSAAAILVAEARQGAAARDREFQEIVGGLGCGPALDLSRRPSCFDPRLGRWWPQDLGLLSRPPAER